MGRPSSVTAPGLVAALVHLLDELVLRSKSGAQLPYRVEGVAGVWTKELNDHDGPSCRRVTARPPGRHAPQQVILQGVTNVIGMSEKTPPTARKPAVRQAPHAATNVSPVPRRHRLNLCCHWFRSHPIAALRRSRERVAAASRRSAGRWSHSGAAAQRRSGAAAQRRSGAAAQRRSGAAAQRRSGAAAQRGPA
jgi:hypothetical protein